MNLIKGKDLKRYFDSLEGLQSFHMQFNYEHNDRAIVIVGMAYVEDLLSYCLENFFPSNSSTVEKVLSHKGFLGTFLSKVEMLYCLGFIDKVIKSDLEKLAEIRNLFAHKTTISFDDEKVKKNCSEFKWHHEAMMMSPPKEASALDIFKVEVNTIVSHLSGIVSICRGEKRVLKTNV
jgi:DNA-binding MltR family transcriptional regulator